MFSSRAKYLFPAAVAAGTAMAYHITTTQTSHSAGKPATQIPKFTPLTVKSVVQETTGVQNPVKRITFALPDANLPLGYQAISAVMLKADVEGQKKPVMKPYNPLNSSPGEFSVCVKKYGNSAKMGGVVHDLVAGDQINVKFGWPQFGYEANKYSTVTCIAGGTGATPMIQLIEAAMSDPTDRTAFSLIFCNKSDRDIFYKTQLDALASTHAKRLKVVYVVEEVCSGDFWPSLDVPSRGLVGRMTKELVEDHCHKPDTTDGLVLVCGPGKMMKAVCGGKIYQKGKSPQQGPLLGILKDCGFSESNVLKI